MVRLSLQHVFDAQQILRSVNVLSVVTGDIGLLYHGVDVATNDVELCVPAASREDAVTALEAHRSQFIRLTDHEDPDFYHPHKLGAARFEMTQLSPRMELHLVVDSSLGFTISAKAIEQGLSIESAHHELVEYCQGVEDKVLSAVTWLTLPVFMGGWLQLALAVKGDVNEIVYLMYAERLLDANDVDQAWLAKSFRDREPRSMAMELLKGKQTRIAGSNWG